MRAISAVVGLSMSLLILSTWTDVKAETIKADVVAFDQPFFWNRLGAMQPQGMIYALRHDVVSIDGGALSPGNVRLKDYKRPRPIVLRMNAGDTLEITFQNLLATAPVDNQQPATRTASIHVIGMQLVDTIASDGSNVGATPSPGGLVAPGDPPVTYKLYAEREGVHHLYSAAAMTGGDGDGGSLSSGLFGAVNVEPEGSVWYRSQVTEADLALATKKDGNGDPLLTGGGQPVLDYDAVYPADHPDRPNLPILKILDDSNNIQHSDLTAIIDPRLSPTYPPNPVYEIDGGKRNDPFREFTIIYHDEIGAVQAFDIFHDPEFLPTLHSVRDAFAINYGTGGIGAEIVANRLGVGPMWDCNECKYEEFFLTSWVVGDPAMVVDVPANTKDGTGNVILGAKATEAFYPDDPSNVYHSYLRDHCKMRLLHGGSKEHHIHHLHSHQWLHSPDSDNSAYLDSQAFGPGAAYTLEMVFNGSGNRNQTVGDAIFHCHFYPHFAMGMWGMWRVHDVFEDGSRLLPDGEIVAGTPIPAVVPMPGLVMAPMPQADVAIVPADANNDSIDDSSQVVVFNDINGNGVVEAGEEYAGGNPGYPFFIPGVTGHRPPHPPLDTIDDGGLPRHVVLSDPLSETVQVQTPFDFTKEIHKMKAQELPEAGTEIELAAMAFHGTDRTIPSWDTDGATGGFVVNGLPAQPGAPFADPCVDAVGNSVGNERIYKAAVVQIDAVINKVGWHFPQMRIITLWGDVADTFSGARAPEPFFFRANTDDCIEYHHVNLVPNVYELDDFQVRTPTDILGQHIHLVKFDVTASDGSANGWNYEDGTFSPDEVRERIHALNEMNPDENLSALLDADGNPQGILTAKAHPSGLFNRPEFLGAQTTVQRWYATPVLNLTGDDRTLRTVFTHDHYGPSTHQQAGLYSALVIEPEGSRWRDPSTGELMGGRALDGGPTSWRADILTGDGDADSYREFLFEYADFQLAYRADSHPDLPSASGPVFPEAWDVASPRTSGEGFSNLPLAVNPPGKEEVGLPFLLGPPAQHLFSEAISADDVGTFTVNYRNEPVPLRVFDPQTGKQATAGRGRGPDALRGDLSHVYSSNVTRAQPELNDPPAQWPYGGGSASEGAETGDPFTPLMRVYNNDNVQIRLLVGATEEGHNFNINGVKWLYEPSWTDSGYRSSQMLGISEHYEFRAPITAIKGQAGATADHLYQPGASVDDQWNGLWGLLRTYRTPQRDLPLLPNNDNIAGNIANGDEFNGACPKDPVTDEILNLREYDVTAVRAADALPNGQLVYNSRVGNAPVAGPLNDPTAILYVLTEDLEDKGPNKGKLKAGVPIEPLVLRANAGDCIQVTLRNNLPEVLHGPDPAFPDTTEDLAGFNTMPMIIENFNANQVRPSSHVGLHAQLLSYDVGRDDGANVGRNVVTQTVPPAGNQSITYQWYAGNLDLDPDGNLVATPVEFGAINLISSDPIKHSNKGAGAALIIEPQGSTWVEDPGSRAAATVTPPSPGEPFREFVTLFQDDINLRDGSGEAVDLLAETEDPEDSGQKAINYRTEPAWFRLGFAPDATLGQTRARTDLDTFVSNSAIGGSDPETPVFTAAKGTPVRFRVLQPGGHARNHVFAVHGHVWQELPYTDDSTKIGDNPLSMFEGARMGHGPSNHFDAVLQNGAGGKFSVEGDYLYRDMSSFLFDGGLWGIFRVTE